MSYLRLLYAVACFCAISQLSHASHVEEKCTFTDCIYQDVHPRRSLIEKYILSLNISKLPHAIIHECDGLKDHVAMCDSERANCPTTLQLPYKDRLHDYVYVDFLMQVGLFSCDYAQEFDELKHCFDEELETCLQSCFHGLIFDRKCVVSEFNEHEHCPPNAVDVFLAVVDKFLQCNPYGNDGLPSNKIKSIHVD